MKSMSSTVSISETGIMWCKSDGATTVIEHVFWLVNYVLLSRGLPSLLHSKFNRVQSTTKTVLGVYSLEHMLL